MQHAMQRSQNSAAVSNIVACPHSSVLTINACKSNITNITNINAHAGMPALPALFHASKQLGTNDKMQVGVTKHACAFLARKPPVVGVQQSHFVVVWSFDNHVRGFAVLCASHLILVQNRFGVLKIHTGRPVPRYVLDVFCMRGQTGLDSVSETCVKRHGWFGYLLVCEAVGLS